MKGGGVGFDGGGLRFNEQDYISREILAEKSIASTKKTTPR